MHTHQLKKTATDPVKASMTKNCILMHAYDRLIRMTAVEIGKSPTTQQNFDSYHAVDIL